MPRRKDGLTLDQHDRLGAELLAMRGRLVALSLELAGAYPKGSPPAIRSRELVDALDRLRAALEGVSGPKLYYGEDAGLPKAMPATTTTIAPGAHG